MGIKDGNSKTRIHLRPQLRGGANLENSFALTLTPSEVEWVLYQLQAPTTRLYPFPFGDESADKVHQLLDAARDSLLERGWIETQPDNKVVLDMTVAGMVGALGFAQTALFVNLFRERDTKPQTRRYFSAEGLLVEQSVSTVGEIVLTALRDPETLNERLGEQLGLKSQTAPSKGTFRCDSTAFADIPYNLAGDGDSAAINQLVGLGAEERFAADLVCAMFTPLWQATLQVITLDPQQSGGVRIVDQMTIIEGIYGLWLIHAVQHKDQTVLEVLPCNAARAKERLSDMTNHLSR
jgi:hypothetical protein